MSFSPQERAYYDQLFTAVDTQDSGVLAGQDALPLLMSANLPQQTLGEIWALSDPDNNGFLTREAWYKAARMVGWLQKGGKTSVDEGLAGQAGPLPTFQGQAPPPVTPQATGPRLPPLTPADRAKFTKIFVGCGPAQGLVSGDKARDVFLKSQLNYDKLGQIWNLADTQGRGSLDLTDFIIGMYLIQSCMANPSLNLPATLPPGTYESASGGRAPASPIVRQNTGPASPIRAQYTGGMQPQRTGQSQSGIPTPTRGSTLGSGGVGTGIGMGSNANWDVTPEAKATSDRFFTQLDAPNRGFIEGDVAVPFMLQSQLDEGTLASIWDLADIRKEGRLNKDEFAVAMHLINAKMAGRDPPATLPMSLVPPSLRQEYSQQPQGVQASGQGQGQMQQPSSAAKDLFDLFADEPITAPTPSFPAPVPVSSAPPSAFQAPQQQQQQQQQQPSSAAKDLFDLFADEPITAPTPSFPAPVAVSSAPSSAFQAPQQQQQQQQQQYPSRSAVASPAFASPRDMTSPPPPVRSPVHADLMGEEDQPIADNSAEIGNKRNQLENTTRGLDSLAKERPNLEKAAESSAAELKDLEEKLTAARAKHENESKAVADLKSRVSEQKEKIQSVNMDYIAAQSDVSALQSERDELEQALLAGKEEVRDLNKRMKEIGEEKAGLVLLLEKLKKDTRQQKGMVSIAKKQLATAEGGRDSVQGEIRVLEQEAEQQAQQQQAQSPVQSPPQAAAVPLPSTPRALSPAATGVSQRSNNPFDRFRDGAKSPASPGTGAAGAFGAGALFGAAAGVVVAGAETLYEAAKEVVSPTDEAAQVHEIAEHARSPAPEHTGQTEQQQQQQQQEPAQAPSASTDFDSAFAEFDDNPPSDQTNQYPAQGAEQSQEVPAEGIPSGIPKSAIPYLRPEPERTASTQAVLGESMPDSPASTVPGAGDSSLRNDSTAVAVGSGSRDVDGDDSSDDEDEGPEDLEAPVKYQTKSDNTPILYPPVGQAPPALSQPPAEQEQRQLTPIEAPKPRRSAPPPPPKAATTVDDLDPFGGDADADADASGDPFGSGNNGLLTREPESTVQHSHSPSQSLPGQSLSGGAAAGGAAAAAGGAAGSRSFDPFGADTDLDSVSAQPQAEGRGSDPFGAAFDGNAGAGAGAAAASAPAASSHNQQAPQAVESDPFGAPLQGNNASAAPSANFGFDDGDFASTTHGQSQRGFGGDDFEQGQGAPAQASHSQHGQSAVFGGVAPSLAHTTSFDDAFGAFGTSAGNQETAAVGNATVPPASGNDFMDDSFGQGAAGSSAGGAFHLPPGAASATAGTHKPVTSGFDDDDDFDFSDAPPVQMLHAAPTASSHAQHSASHGKDDFDFDDEFEQPSNANSDGSKSYEMVSPPSGGLAPPINQPADVWGMSGGQQQQHQAGTGQAANQAPRNDAFSFDDAFGGDAQPAQQAGNSLNPPSLPERRDSGVGAQPDDIEDVKKLCAMGFPRSLVIEALGANGYDFQKTLNVLLQ